MPNRLSHPLQVPTRLLNVPLLITRNEADAMLTALSGTPPVIEGRKMAEQTNLLSYPASRIAIIPVIGGLSHRGYGWYWSMSYGDIRREFRAALADAQAEVIVLDIDSPGGEVAGCFDLVDEIYAARGKKEIIAVANEACFSAAYAIASAADKVYLSRTASVGSIGVIAIHYEQSKAEENIGVKYTAIFSGDRKNDFSPHEPISKDAMAYAQAAVAANYDIFCATVARNRGMTEKAVRETNAGIYSGADAVAAGLADAVMPVGEVLSGLVTTIEKGGSKMSLEQIQQELSAGVADPVKKAMVIGMLAGMGFFPAPDPAAEQQRLDAATAAGRLAGTAEATERAAAILAAHDVAFGSNSTLVSGLIKDGVTLEEAQQRIVNAKSDATAGHSINSGTSPFTGEDKNPLIADAERRSVKQS